MKRIELKPKVILGENVFYAPDKKLLTVTAFDDNDVKLTNKDGYCKSMSRAWFDKNCYIIESPDEQKGLTITETGRPSGRCVCGGEYCKGECDSCGEYQVSDADELAEQKPSLKLRVGGVYRNHQEETVKIVARLSDENVFNPFVTENGDSYQENGRWLDREEDSELDLIEEVQPEQEPFQQKNEALKPTNLGIKQFYCGLHGSSGFNDVGQCPLCQMEHSMQKKLIEVLQSVIADLKKMLLRKPEGNPFKVGDKVKIYLVSDQAIEYVLIGFVKEVQGSSIKINPHNYIQSYNGYETYCYHYKQCERVR